MTLPLHGHELYRSTDLDEIRERMSTVLCPHEVGLRDRDGVLDGQMNSLCVGDVVLNYVRYGASVWVDPGYTKDFLALQIPLTGLSEVHSGIETIESTPDVMLVSRHDEPLRMTLSADAQLLLTRLSLPFLVGKLDALLGLEAPWPLRFDLGMDMRAEPQQTWFRLLRECYRRVSRPNWTPERGLWGPHFQERLAIGLLRAQPNNYSDILTASALPASRRVVRQAMAVLDGTPESAHTECSLATDLGISARSLNVAFRAYLDTSVSRYLFHIRLGRAYVELREAQPDEVSVDEVAQRWGFTPLGFRSCYLREFGESPMETLYS